MEIKINFHAELERTSFKQLEYFREEFDYLFGQKLKYSKNDRDVAESIISYLAKLVNSKITIDQLSDILEDLEGKYPTLF